jgi:hypothetical protein
MGIAQRRRYRLLAPVLTGCVAQPSTFVEWPASRHSGATRMRAVPVTLRLPNLLHHSAAPYSFCVPTRVESALVRAYGAIP